MKKLWLISVVFCLAIAPSAEAQTLKKGMRGESVRQWQRFLNTRNFDLPVDGYFGPQTHRATVIFQQKWKITPASGVVGPKTLAKARQLAPQLFDKSASKSSAPRRRTVHSPSGRPSYTQSNLDDEVEFQVEAANMGNAQCRFVGSVTNVGNRTIPRFHVQVVFPNLLWMEHDQLAGLRMLGSAQTEEQVIRLYPSFIKSRGGELTDIITTIRNLRPGETRNINAIATFSSEDIRNPPAGVKDTYVIFWPPSKYYLYAILD